SPVMAGNLVVETNDVVGSVKRHRANKHKASLRHRGKARKAKKTVRIWKDKEHALDGIASFYMDDTATASGEQFDNNAMAAAHRSLPFGTHIRVTDVETGNSIMVRINDRGPYVEGRCIDLTSAAANALGITKERGIAKVKLEVVEEPAEPGITPKQSAEIGNAPTQSAELGNAPKPVVE